MFVIPAVPYLQSLGLSFTVSTVALGAGLAVRGSLPAGDLAMSGLAILPAVGGMAVGQAIRSRISPAVFRRGFLVCPLLLGTEMALRPLL